MAKAVMTQQRIKDLTAQQRAAELAAQQRAAEEQARRAAEERARREAEERARRRAAIQSQIHQWDDKLLWVNSQLSGLETEQSNLNSYLGDWSTQKNIYSGNDILSEVVIVNVFEGVCADKIKSDFSACIKKMDQTCGGVYGLNGNVSAQIVRLRQYVSTINARLTSLRNELNSI